MDAFNSFIADNGLVELHRIGGKFTWTNKQANPVMCVLDRVLVCNIFNSHYGEASCESVTRVGSDHNPLVVNTLDGRFSQQRHNFSFQTSWLDQREFKETVVGKWPVRGESAIQDFWREVKAATRKYCKGWGANTQSQLKKDKSLLLEKIDSFDKEVESRGLDASHWQTRYDLEAALETIYCQEEHHLKQLSGIKTLIIDSFMEPLMVGGRNAPFSF
jgi:hypothetical protein